MEPSTLTGIAAFSAVIGGAVTFIFLALRIPLKPFQAFPPASSYAKEETLEKAKELGIATIQAEMGLGRLLGSREGTLLVKFSNDRPDIRLKWKHAEQGLLYLDCSKTGLSVQVQNVPDSAGKGLLLREHINTFLHAAVLAESQRLADERFVDDGTLPENYKPLISL